AVALATHHRFVARAKELVLHVVVVCCLKLAKSSDFTKSLPAWRVFYEHCIYKLIQCRTVTLHTRYGTWKEPPSAPSFPSDVTPAEVTNGIETKDLKSAATLHGGPVNAASQDTWLRSFGQKRPLSTGRPPQQQSKRC